MGNRKTFILVATSFAAISVLALFPLFFLGKTFFRADITYNIEPSTSFVSNYFVAHHCLPLWNPWILGGVPQVAVAWPPFYLPAYLSFFLPFGIGTAVYVFFHLMIAGIGAFLWQMNDRQASEEGAGNVSSANGGSSGSGSTSSSFVAVLAATFFALTLMLNGYTVGSSINFALIAGISWIPLALLLVDQISIQPKWWQCGALALVLAFQLGSGRPEIAMGAYFLYGCRLLFNTRKSFKQSQSNSLAKSLMLVALSMVLSVVSNAANFVPLFELISNNPSATKFSVLNSLYWSTGWQDWLTMLMPLPFGTINMATTSSDVSYPGAIPYITSLYLGPAVLTLAILGAGIKPKKSLFWIGFALVFSLLSLGEFGPIAFLFRNQNLIRYPIKFAIFVIFALIAIATQGWRTCFLSGADELSGNKGVLKKLRAALAVAWGALAIFSLGMILPPPHGLRSFWIQLVVAGALGLFTCAIIGHGKRPVFRQMLLLVVSAAALLCNWNVLLANLAPQSIYSPHSEIAEFIKQKVKLNSREYRILPLIDNTLAPPYAIASLPNEALDQSFTSYCRNVLRPNCNMDFEMQTSNGMPVVPTWQSLFIDTGVLPRSRMTTNEHPLGKSDAPLYRFCQATSTAFVETPADADDGAGNWMKLPLLDPKLFKLIQVFDKLNVRIYEVADYLPHLTLIENARFISDRKECLKYLNRADSNGFDPLKEVLLLGPDSQKSVLNPHSTAKHNSGNADDHKGGADDHKGSADADRTTESIDLVKLEVNENDYQRIEANLFSPKYLLTTDSYYPGWHAFDNGQPVEILIANGLTRAIHLSKGAHRIELFYQPDSLKVGLIGSAIGLVASLTLLLCFFRRRQV